MFCSHCGREVTDDARSCRGCGAELQVPLPGNRLDDEIVRIAQQSGKIAAIKYYREQTGSDLKSSKKAVDEIVTARGIITPSTGCLGMFVFALLIVWKCWAAAS